MFSTAELVLYVFLPAYVAMFVMAYVVRRRNREAVPSLLPAKPLAPAARKNFGEWIAINFGPLGCLVFLPLLLVLAALLYPYWIVALFIRKRREGQFLDRMRLAGRTIRWEQLQQRLRSEQAGTLLNEVLSAQAPGRLWWTPDAVAGISPFPYQASGGDAIISMDYDEQFTWLDEKFIPFGEWCRTRYTSETSGNAILVDLGVKERKLLWEKVRRAGFLYVWTGHRRIEA